MSHQGNKINLSAEQVTAAYLNKLKEIVEINQLKHKELVLSVPAYFNEAERKALIDAAAIAGIPLTKIIDEQEAVALNYGISKRLDLDEQHGRNVLFIDFGHSKFSTYLCNLKKESGSVLYQSHSRNLGCKNIDTEIFEFYRSMFLKNTGSDLGDSKKASIKLMDAIEKQRKILSGIKEHEMNLEYLMDENDLQYTLKRSELEDLAKAILN